ESECKFLKILQKMDHKQSGVIRRARDSAASPLRRSRHDSRERFVGACSTPAGCYSAFEHRTVWAEICHATVTSLQRHRKGASISRLGKSEEAPMRVHQRAVDLLLNVQDAADHVDNLTQEDVRRLLKEIGIVLELLLDRALILMRPGSDEPNMRGWEKLERH